MAPIEDTAASSPPGDPPAPASSPGALAAGTRIAHFLLRGKLGQGGMGVVYRATDEKLRREVALKLLPPELVTDAETRKRFLREARTAASLTHPSIATIYEIGEDGEHVFIAMELVRGRTLRAARPSSVTAVVAVVREVVRGVAKAHAAGVVHRDLKPDNVMVDEDGQVKILDFGIAKLLAPNDEPVGKGASLVTRDGAIVGTPAYMAPEQALGGAVDHRADLFALGVILYELLTGENPFVRETLIGTVVAVTRDMPPPPSSLNVDVPAELDRIVLRCLAKKPDERFADANALLADLRDWELGTSMPTLPRMAALASADTPLGLSTPSVTPLVSNATPAIARTAAPRRRAPVVFGALVVILASGAGFGAWRTLVAKTPAAPRAARSGGIGEGDGGVSSRPNIGVLSSRRIAAGSVIEEFIPSLDFRRNAMLEPRGLVVTDLESGAEQVFPQAVEEGEHLVSWYADGDRMLLIAPGCAGASHRATLTAFSVRDARRSIVGAFSCEPADVATVFAAMSLDGKIYYTRKDADGEPSLWQLGVDGGNSRRIASAPKLSFGMSLLVSPDGRWLTYLAVDDAPECGGACFVAASVDGRQSHVFVSGRRFLGTVGGGALYWRGRDEVIYSAQPDPPGEPMELEIWAQPVDVEHMRPVGSPRQLTRGEHSSIQALYASLDGRRALAHFATTRSSVIVAPITGPGRIGTPARVTQDSADELLGRWSLDSAALYFSTSRTGHGDVVRWVPASGQVEPVFGTPDFEAYPIPRSDGSFYAFTAPFVAGRVGTVCSVKLVTGGTASPTGITATNDAILWPCAFPGFLCDSRGSHCLVGRSDGDGILWSALDSGRDVVRLSATWFVGVSPDGSRLVIAAPDGGLRFLDVASGRITPHAVSRDRVFTMAAFAPDGDDVYATEAMPGTPGGAHQLDLVEPDGTVRVLRAESGESIWFPLPSPDGRYVAWLTLTSRWELRLLELGPER